MRRKFINFTPMCDENDFSDEESLNDVAERMELVDISDVSEEEFHGFYDQ